MSDACNSESIAAKDCKLVDCFIESNRFPENGVSDFISAWNIC